MTTHTSNPNAPIVIETAALYNIGSGLPKVKADTDPKTLEMQLLDYMWEHDRVFNNHQYYGGYLGVCTNQIREIADLCALYVSTGQTYEAQQMGLSLQKARHNLLNAKANHKTLVLECKKLRHKIFDIQRILGYQLNTRFPLRRCKSA
jgi:hypothetical protein